MPDRNDTEHAEHVETLRDLLSDVRTCMFTTVDTDGTPWSRPMAIQEAEFDGDLWFFSRKDSEKLEHIRRNRKVGVAVAQPGDSTYVTLAGRALVVHDDAKTRELWSEAARAWFPEGPDSDKLCLIKVEVQRAEYWTSPSNVLVMAFGYAKAVLTGEPPRGELSDNAKVDL